MTTAQCHPREHMDLVFAFDEALCTTPLLLPWLLIFVRVVGYLDHAGIFFCSDNFRLVVLDGDDGGAADGASSKAQAAENAKNFLRERIGSQKRVSHTLFKARKRLGPSPNF